MEAMLADQQQVLQCIGLAIRVVCIRPKQYLGLHSMLQLTKGLCDDLLILSRALLVFEIATW